MSCENYKVFLIYEGSHYSVYFHAQSKTQSEVYDYFRKCDDATRASLLFLVKRLSDAGRVYDQTKFRLEDARHKIYVFKPRKERFFCFFMIGKKVIVTSAYRKKRQKLDTQELNRAIKIKNMYSS
jgi:hypothetical protein